jgi:hypothetical protein
MKPRARRVTIAAAVLGVGVSGVFVVANWGTVCDHVEAWHFQLMRETRTITSDETWSFRAPGVVVMLDCIAMETGRPVIFVPKDADFFELWEYPQSGGEARKFLDAQGYRVLEQRFPRRAYVVIRDNP